MPNQGGESAQYSCPRTDLATGSEPFFGTIEEFVRKMPAGRFEALYGDIQRDAIAKYGYETGLDAAHESFKYWFGRPDKLHLNGVDHFISLIKDKSKNISISVARPSDSYLVSKARDCFLFAHRLAPGDIVFLKASPKENDESMQKFLSMGIVASNYRYDAQRLRGKHFREIEWQFTADGQVKEEPELSHPLMRTRKALTWLGTKEYRELSRDLCQLFDYRPNTAAVRSWLFTSANKTLSLEHRNLVLEHDRADDLSRFADFDQTLSHIKSVYVRPGNPEAEPVEMPAGLFERKQQLMLDRADVLALETELGRVKQHDALWVLRAAMTDDALIPTKIKTTWKVKIILEQLRWMGQTGWDYDRVQKAKTSLKNIARGLFKLGGNNAKRQAL